MNYILKPSLVHMTYVRIAVTLWNKHNIRDLIGKFSTPLHSIKLEGIWSMIEDIVAMEVSELPLPKLLKERMLGFVIQIGVQILNWIEYHDALNLNIGIPFKFYWTSHGTINKKETAQVFINDESIDTTIRYKLACIYCLEGNIKELWEKMPEDQRKIFYNEEIPTHDARNRFVIIWTYGIKGEINKMFNLFNISLSRYSSLYQYAFEAAALGGYEVGTEYFLQKLNRIERKQSFIRIAGEIVLRASKINQRAKKYSNIVYVLLSQMDYEEQVELCKIYSYKVLNCFLDWPRPILFMEVANHVWDLCSCSDCEYTMKMDYETLLRRVVYKLDCYKDFSYKALFQEIWLKGSNDQKKLVLDHFFINYALPLLLKNKDVNNIKLIFQDATHTAKNRFICSIGGENVCGSLIDSEEWGLLGFFIQECLSSEKEVKKFKEAFKRRTDIAHIFPKDDLETRKLKLNNFFLLLDNIVCGFSKRNCVEDDNRPTKRPCKND